jgi:hypothetical protein
LANIQLLTELFQQAIPSYASVVTYSPIPSTARGKFWAALCRIFCIENQDGNAAHFFPRAVFQYIFVL